MGKSWTTIGLVSFLICVMILLVPNVRAKVTRVFFDTAWWAYERHLLPGDIRTLSLPVHFFGMHFIRSGLSFEDALTVCTRHFRGGCLHGVVMEYALTLLKRTPATLFEVCGSLVDETTADDFQYFQCVHAVGHIFMMESISPADAVSSCSLFLPAYQNACASGVFMQYSVVAPMTSHHHNVIHESTSLPCDTIADPFRNTCYISEGFYRHYFPNTNDFEASYAYCSKFNEQEATWCKEGVEKMRAEIIDP